MSRLGVALLVLTLALSACGQYGPPQRPDSAPGSSALGVASVDPECEDEEEPQP